MVVQICSPIGSLHHSEWYYRYDSDAPCFVGYPGYWLLLGKPDEYHTVQTSSARIQDFDVILTWRLYLPGVEPGISRSWLKYSPTRPNKRQIWCLFGLDGEYFNQDREIPGSTPGRYNLQIKITSLAAASMAVRECQEWNGQYCGIKTGQAAHLSDPKCAVGELSGDASLPSPAGIVFRDWWASAKPVLIWSGQIRSTFVPRDFTVLFTSKSPPPRAFPHLFCQGIFDWCPSHFGVFRVKQNAQPSGLRVLWHGHIHYEGVLIVETW